MRVCSSTYLINRQCIRVPGFDSRLVDVNYSDADFGAHLSDNAASGSPHISSPNAAYLLYLKHLGTKTFSFSHLADAFVQSDVQMREQLSYEQ